MAKTAFFILLFSGALSICAAQQQALPERISIQVYAASLEEVIQLLEKEYNISFYYSPNKLPLEKKVSIKYTDITLTAFLDELCLFCGIQYKIRSNQVIFYSPVSIGPKPVTISGFVSDSLTGERLIGATVFFPELHKGAQTNEYGFFSFSLAPGTYRLKCSYIGYVALERNIKASKSMDISLTLYNKPSEIKPVLLESSLNRTVNLFPGTDILPATLMANYPALLGEKDVVQFLKLMPGVQTTTDGLNGLYVRGCLPQHTAFLIDDAPMMNMFHFSGWFSTINPDAIKDVTLHKSHLPGKIGGSLASVAEISLRDGNNQHFNATGGAGTITSRLTLEGPIIRQRSSFIISFRRSYLDQMIRLFNLEKTIDIGKIYFYDLNAKINFTLNARNRFYLSSYAGKDVFDDQGGTSWGNSLISTRWNHLFSDKVFGNLTLTGSGYDHYFKGLLDEGDYYRIDIGMRNYNIKYDLAVFSLLNRKMNMGFNCRYILFPSVKVSGNLISMNKLPDNKSTYKLLVNTFYYQGDFNISRNLSSNLGLRLVLAGKIYPDNVKSRVDPEPVISFHYKSGKDKSIKIGYSRNHQYFHGVSVFDLIIPFDKYFLWGNRLKPQIADHFSAGFYYSPLHQKAEFSVEPYYSFLKNQYRIPITEEVFFTREPGPDPVAGDLKVAGADFSIRKTTGRFTGFLSYTLMKTFKKEEGINNNNYFQTYYDRRHDLVLNMNYRISRRLLISSNWVYMSGNPYSLPVAKYELRGRSIPLYDNNNLYNRRMPAYHRLDLSIRIGLGKYVPCRHNLSFMVYNAYAHKNPVFYRYSDVVDGNTEKDANVPGGERLFSMMGYYFFNIFPAFSYEFKFGN